MSRAGVLRLIRRNEPDAIEQGSDWITGTSRQEAARSSARRLLRDSNGDAHPRLSATVARRLKLLL